MSERCGGAWAQLLVVLVNAVVGGITVWTGLNPYVVAGHFLAAMLLLTSTAISYDIAHRHRARTTAHAAESWLARAVLAAGVPLVVIGAVLTGAGPHPGDSADVHRIPLDWTLLTVTHGFLAIVVLVLALACAVTAERQGDDLARLRAIALTGVLLAQSALGIYQRIKGLPPLAVVLHLLGASLTWVGVIRLYLAARHSATPHSTAQRLLQEGQRSSDPDSTVIRHLPVAVAGPSTYVRPVLRRPYPSPEPCAVQMYR